MREPTNEEKDFLVDYSMESNKNIWLALTIGSVIPTIERRILSSFLAKLDESIKKEIESRDDLHWRTCIPRKDLKEEDLENFTILYVMTMEDQGIEIHIGLYDWNTPKKHRELYIGTHKERENKKVRWPAEHLKGFLGKSSILKDKTPRHWWFCPAEYHRYFNTIEALSTLNDGPNIKYFTNQLVCLAGDISRELGE